MGELSLGYSQMTCVASLKEHCAQNRFQKLTTTSIVDDGKKKKGRAEAEKMISSYVINQLWFPPCSAMLVRNLPY